MTTGRPDQAIEAGDEEPQLRPAVGVLVEPEPKRGGREDHAREDEEREAGAEEVASPAGNLVGANQEQARERHDPGELEVALPRVVAVGHADRGQGVRAAEEVHDLHDRERREEDVHGDEHDDRPRPAGPAGNSRVAGTGS